MFLILIVIADSHQAVILFVLFASIRLFFCQDISLVV